MDSKNNKSSFQFSNPILVKSLFISNNFDNDSDGYEMTVHFETEVDYISNNIAEVTLRVFNIDISNVNNYLEKNVPYILDIVMSAQFKWSSSIADPSEFLRQNAPSLIFSYMRPYISTITGMSKFSKTDIPFVDFTNNKLINEKEDD